MDKGKKNVIIMHISDVHSGIDNAKPPKYINERKETLKAFHRDFGKIPSDWRPDIIAISGDLGWTGCCEDYKEFTIFFRKLLEEANLKPEDVICCPGNHDKYLPKEQKFPRTIKGVFDYHSIDDIWSNMELLSKNFENYSQGLKDLDIKPLQNGSNIEDTQYLYGYRIINGICFVVLNSAWLCDWRKGKGKKNSDADRGNLLLDINLVYDIIGKGLPNMPIIAMYHHPKSWLKLSEIFNPDDPRHTSISYIEKNANIVLNGHTHNLKAEHTRQSLNYIAGTISSDDTYQSQCYLLKININEKDVRLSTIKEGRYYSGWIEQEVSWFFDEKAGTCFFDIEAMCKSLQNEVENIKKTFHQFLNVASNQKVFKKGQENYDEFCKYIRGLKQQLDNKDKELKEIQLNDHILEDQLENQTDVQLETISILQDIMSILSIDPAKTMIFFQSLWNSLYDDALSDTKEKEETMRLIKSEKN